jgi:CubicO group peptidase (beta-lactamase class C family)
MRAKKWPLMVDGSVQLQDVRQGATLQDLLRHTAGLTYEFLGASAVQRQYAQARIGSRSRSNAEFSHELAALPLVAEPGTLWEYGRGTDVLGRVIEVVSGQTLGTFLSEKHLAAPWHDRHRLFLCPVSTTAALPSRLPATPKARRKCA